MAIDKPTIVKTALALLETTGMEGLTTRRLAAELGIKGPSLYWHYKNRQALLDDLCAAMLREALPGPDLDSKDFDWAKWLADGARGLRRVALSRRDGAVVMAASGPKGEIAAKAYGAMVATLQRSGLSEEDSRLTLLTLGRFAIGWALYEQTAMTGAGVVVGEAGFEFGLETFIRGLKARLAA